VGHHWKINLKMITAILENGMPTFVSILFFNMPAGLLRAIKVSESTLQNKIGSSWGLRKTEKTLVGR